MNVAICVATYMHPEVVEDVLNKAIDLYKRKEIDVYYYDSSSNEKTKNIVEGYINKGYDNLYYIQLPSEVPVDDKLSMIFAGEGQKKEYKYLWPVKDRVYFNESTLEQVEEAMNEQYDAILLGVLPCFAHPIVEDRIYTDVAEFYLDWGYMATSLDVNIYRIDTVLKDFDRKNMEGYDKNFTHFTVLFENIVDGMRIKLLKNKGITAINSRLGQSTWTKKVFSIWKNDWIYVNEILPERYNKHKSNVIKQAGKLPWIFGTVDILIKYHELGILVPDNLEEILKDWDKVSDISKDKVIAIANNRYDRKHDLDYVPKNKDEILDILVQICEMVKCRKIEKEKIPFDDIIQVYMSRVIARYGKQDEKIYIIAGSLEDIINNILDKRENPEDICKEIQMLITMFLLLK